MTGHFADDVDPDTWEPGIPLYSKQAHAHSLYLYNFRDDPTSETCGCGDSARWPKPDSRHLPEGDELAKFIAEHRVWRAQQERAS